MSSRKLRGTNGGRLICYQHNQKYPFLLDHNKQQG